MNTKPEKLPSPTKQSAFFAAKIGLALASFALGACSSLVSHPTPTSSWTQRTGQVKFTSAGTNIVGDIVIRHDADNFLAEISKAPGVPLLTISARYGTGKSKTSERHMTVVKASGPLASGGWTWNSDSQKNRDKAVYSKLSDTAKAWCALPEVFEWAQARAKGGEFPVYVPDIIMHSRTSGEFVELFDYRRVENPSTVASISDVTPADRKKLPVMETVICRLVP